MYFSLMYIPIATSFQAILGWVATLQASNTYRLGIYQDNGSGVPGALILDAGTIDASTTGQKSITISQSLSGLIWLAAVEQGGSGGAQLFMYPNLDMSDLKVTGTGNYGAIRSSSTSVSGGLPNPAGAVSVSSLAASWNAPWIWLRVT
jgi:hypothetical protein